MAATAAGLADFTLTNDAGLKWYRSSDTAKRGFCGTCGSTLFWQGDGNDYIAITGGSIDGDSGLRTEGHIFCESAGDYYEITGGEYQVQGDGTAVSVPNGDYTKGGRSAAAPHEAADRPRWPYGPKWPSS